MEAENRTNEISKQNLNKPLVSVVTVVLNGDKHIEQTIQSVINQTYLNIEYIIIDGKSTDNTLNIINKYKANINQFISEKDNGIFDAMNKGLSKANGILIGILNADDYYEPTAIENTVNTYVTNNSDILHGNMVIESEHGQQLVKPDISKMKQQPSIFHPTCFVKKTVYNDIGMFDTKYKISSDYDFLLRCLNRNYKFSYVDSIITHFRPGGMSGLCKSNIEGYHIMKHHKTGYHNHVIWRGIKCYIKTFLKKVINLIKFND